MDLAMKMDWSQHHFEYIETEDGSPSLRILGMESQEAMHHSGGAYSETQEIYGEPVREMIQQGGRSVLSVGLGLGYNEILVAAEALRAQIAPSDFGLLSFESEASLRDHFLNWLSSSDETFVYDQIFKFFQFGMAQQNAFSLEKQRLKHWLSEMLSRGNWKLEEALPKDFAVSRKYELILYDAFSSKTTPLLWDEEFLVSFLVQAAADSCQFSSYACKGTLKRALTQTGFQIIPRKGFSGKRNSTMATRKRP